MALEAGGGLEPRFHREARRHVGHDGVAIATGYTALLMHAAWPIGSFAALVTVKTDGIVLFCGPARIVWSERNDAPDAQPTDRRCFADEGRDGPHRCVFRAFGLLRSEARVIARDIINRALVKRGENPI